MPELLEKLEIIDGADLILLDWDLPRMPGIDLLDELRRRGIELPVVFLTGYGSTEHEPDRCRPYIHGIRGG